MMEHPEMLASPAEQLEHLKSHWLVDFIQKSGFDHLMEIMKTIIKKNMNVEQS